MELSLIEIEKVIWKMALSDIFLFLLLLVKMSIAHIVMYSIKDSVWYCKGSILKFVELLCLC